MIDLHQTGFVGKGSDHLQLIKFWPSHAPGKGVCDGARTFGSALLQPACSVCVSLSAFSFFKCFDAVGWMTGRTSGLYKCCTSNIQRFFIGRPLHVPGWPGVISGKVEGYRTTKRSSSSRVIVIAVDVDCERYLCIAVLLASENDQRPYDPFGDDDDDDDDDDVAVTSSVPAVPTTRTVTTSTAVSAPATVSAAVF